MANGLQIKGSKPITSDLCTVTVGDELTCLEITDNNGARITGDLKVTGDITGNIKDVTFDDLTIGDITCGDLTADSVVIDNLTINDNEITASTTLTIDCKYKFMQN